VFGIDWWVQGNGSLVVVPLTQHLLSSSMAHGARTRGTSKEVQKQYMNEAELKKRV